MDKPELYSKFNAVTKSTVSQLLKEYAEKIKWRNSNESIIDLGSGDGTVTTLLKKYIQSKDVKFIGSDVNEKMVKFANEHYLKENITFRVLDMGGNLSYELKQGFNHVFSFFAIQFVNNQEKVFNNIYDLMTPGGDCFLIIAKSLCFYNFLIHAFENDKWKPCLKDVNKFVSPYYYMENPEKQLTKMMETIGFTNIDVQCRKITHVMQNGNECKSLMKAVLNFNMTDDELEEFAQDSVPLAKELGLLDPVCKTFEEHDKPLDFNIEVLIVYATK